MALHIDDGWLAGDFNGKTVVQEPCRGKDSGPFTGSRPDTLVIHFTAGSSLASAVNTLKNPDVKASAHLIIDTDGSLCQLIGFDRIAWHAGDSQWQQRRWLNKYSIGIELVNAGELQRSGDHYVSWFGKRYQQQEVIEAVHQNQSRVSYWHAYNEPQIEACFAVCRQLRQAYQIEWILGHEEIAPERKTDPGPAFPLDKLRNDIFSRRDDTAPTDIGQASEPLTSEAENQNGKDTVMIARVTASKLNIRQQPYASAELAAAPLPLDTQVEIVDKAGNWKKVRVYTEGWVHGDYIAPVD